MSEFDLIRTYFNRLGSPRADVSIDIGDDAAVVDVAADRQLVLAVDTMVAGVHFPVDTPADAIGYKALTVNLSDLAAMGAEPAWALLAITLPSADIDWIEAFCSGFHRLAAQFGLRCIGGDTTRGPLTISVTVAGTVPRGHALTRRGAKVGDAIYVTGNIGDAGLGLEAAFGRWSGPNSKSFLQRLYYPTPRVEMGRVLRDYASAAIDVSDGLLADLGHVLHASGVGARLELTAIPVSAEVLSHGGYDFALAAGDDYELCFTVPKAKQRAMENALAQNGLVAYRIGEITAAQGLKCIAGNGEIHQIKSIGYNHFA